MNTRYYSIAGMTLELRSPRQLLSDTLTGAYNAFEVARPGKDRVVVEHREGLPDLDSAAMGPEVCRCPPWVIHRNGDRWTYLGVDPSATEVQRVVICDSTYSTVSVHSPREMLADALAHGFGSLTLLPTDQMILAPALAERKALIVHAAGIVLNGTGLVFLGHSGAGKSTMCRSVRGAAEILSDDRTVIRRHADGLRIHGTWSHGDVPDVSPRAAPLKALCLLEKAGTNRIDLLTPGPDLVDAVLSCVIRPLASGDWWAKVLSVVSDVLETVPCYRVFWDGSRAVVPLLTELAEQVGDS